MPEGQSNCVENTRVTQTMYILASPMEMDIENELSVSRNGYPTFFSTNPNVFTCFSWVRDKKA